MTNLNERVHITHVPGLSTDYCLFGGHAQMCKMLLTQYIQPTSGTG